MIKQRAESIEVYQKNNRDDLLQIEKEEQELAQTLSDKYGKGSLDIETGTFTPIE